MNEEKHEKKEEYETPQIYRIKLAPDELAVTGCKASGPSPGVCNNGGVLVNKEFGS